MSRAVRARWALAAAALGLALAVPEALGRLLVPPVEVPGGFVYDARRGWAFPPGREVVWRDQRIRVNRLGLRGPEPRGDDATRVLVLGDSSVFGHALEEDQTFVAWLGRLLADRGPVDVQNGGVPGYTCPQSRELLREVADRFPPDLLLVYDMHSDLRGAVDRDLLFTGAGRFGRLGSVRLLSAAALRLRVARARPSTWEGAYARCLDDLATAARDGGGTPVFVIPLVRGDLRGDPIPCPPGEPSLCGYRAAMRRVAEAHGAPLVDLPALLGGSTGDERPFLMDDVHPTPAGSAAMAVAIQAIVAPLVASGAAP